MKFVTVFVASAAAAAMVPSVASAASTVGIAFSQTLDDKQYNVFTRTFDLPTDFTNATFTINYLNADDAAVVALNGSNLYGAGIFGPGNGYFYFTPTGGSTPFTFAGNSDSSNPANVTFTGPFVAGTNTLTVYVNNNYAGINRDNGPLTGGPSGIDFSGTVTYDTAAVPEPATWGMMLLGFGMVGFGLRGRRARSVRVTYA